MASRTQAERFAHAFQSQVARNPGAVIYRSCMSSEWFRSSITLCLSGHDTSHGHVLNLLVVNRLQAPRPLYKVQAWLEWAGLSTVLLERDCAGHPAGIPGADGQPG